MIARKSLSVILGGEDVDDFAGLSVGVFGLAALEYFRLCVYYAEQSSRQFVMYIIPSVTIPRYILKGYVSSFLNQLFALVFMLTCCITKFWYLRSSVDRPVMARQLDLTLLDDRLLHSCQILRRSSF